MDEANRQSRLRMLRERWEKALEDGDGYEISRIERMIVEAEEEIETNRARLDWSDGDIAIQRDG